MKRLLPPHAPAMSLVLVLALALSACVSAPPPTEVAISARLLDKAALKSAYGSKAGENPYIEPVGLVMGQREEFAVVELKVSLPAKATVSLSAQLDGPEGPGAELKYRDDFHAYWSIYEDMPGTTLRSSKIDAVCLPSGQFESKAGTRAYYLVFVGKNPIPRPAEISVQVVVKGQPMKAFILPLTNPVPGKGLIK